MTARLDPKQLIAARELVVAPPAHPAPRACTDRDLNIPTARHARVFGLFLA